MSILTKAEDIINGTRRTDYGHPAVNHQRTADLFTVYLRSKYGMILTPEGDNVVLTPEDVCMLNILQKISREMNRPTEDGLIDIAGYAGNVEMIRNFKS